RFLSAPGDPLESLVPRRRSVATSHGSLPPSTGGQRHAPLSHSIPIGLKIGIPHHHRLPPRLVKVDRCPHVVPEAGQLHHRSSPELGMTYPRPPNKARLIL